MTIDNYKIATPIINELELFEKEYKGLGKAIDALVSVQDPYCNVPIHDGINQTSFKFDACEIVDFYKIRYLKLADMISVRKRQLENIK